MARAWVTPEQLRFIEDWRKSWIGVPRFWRSTTLPANHVYPDGSLVLFDDWPEFKAVYDTDGFAGMLMPWNADSATQAANLGKFRPNSANPRDYICLCMAGQFFRNWALGAAEGAGAWHRDETRNVEGHFGVFPVSGGGWFLYGDGAWGPDPNLKINISYGTGFPTGNNPSPKFMLSNAVPTGPKNVPEHIWQPIILYLGRPA